MALFSLFQEMKAIYALGAEWEKGAGVSTIQEKVFLCSFLSSPFFSFAPWLTFWYVYFQRDVYIIFPYKIRWQSTFSFAIGFLHVIYVFMSGGIFLPHYLSSCITFLWHDIAYFFNPVSWQAFPLFPVIYYCNQTDAWFKISYFDSGFKAKSWRISQVFTLPFLFFFYGDTIQLPLKPPFQSVQLTGL